MSSDIAIRVQDLSKHYHIYNTPKDRLKQFVVPRLQRLIGAEPSRFFDTFTAVNGVSFEIYKGEAIGVVGGNGSGKSTLLQLICGTLTPSDGNIETIGRVSALLELGSGFNPEFTGRENVCMNALIQGLSKKEIDERFDDIATFAEIGDFMEQPVKTYSSGMVVRLAFSVAINVDPDILIIDEALSVGDEFFQRKCFSRIEGLKKRGTTILFVSHSGSAVIELCDRAYLMSLGENIAVGLPKTIVAYHQKLLYAPDEEKTSVRASIRDAWCATIPETENFASDPNSSEIEGELETAKELFDSNLKPTSAIEYESIGAKIAPPYLSTLSGIKVNYLVRGRKYRYVYDVHFTQDACNVIFGMLIKTTSGVELGGGKSQDSGRAYFRAGSVYKVEFTFRCVLNPGTYFLNAGVIGSVGASEIYLHRVLDSAVFKVLPEENLLSTGLVCFDCQAVFEEAELSKPEMKSVNNGY